jgi:hypothetical protein
MTNKKRCHFDEQRWLCVGEEKSFESDRWLACMAQKISHLPLAALAFAYAGSK